MNHEEFVENLIVLGKNAGTISTEFAQVLTAYKHIDAPLRSALPKPTVTTSISDFIKPDWKTHNHRITDYRNSSSEKPAMKLQNQGKPRDRFKSPSHQFRQPYLPHRANTAQNYPAEMQSGQTQDEKQGFQSEILDPYDEVYIQGMDSFSVRNDKPFIEGYHLAQFSTIAKLLAKQSSMRPQKATASDPSKSATCTFCDSVIASRNKLNHIKSHHKRSKNYCTNLTFQIDDPFTKNQSNSDIKTYHEMPPKTTLQLVASNVPKPVSPPLGYSFRGRRYAQVQVIPHSPENNLTWACIDSGCMITLIDKKFLI
ncbi:hypothetical protein OnM2_021043 [Erysiphe neolycopersici]|uniref:Uncharacterized protein n=1 Tax=Erysiphe neolycopersici TaxID=212602 RepID=A0A420I2Y3_9PEZI|nr:hypothetical protein OnM2_021043 [Erysiphe neolycopersici]